MEVTAIADSAVAFRVLSILPVNDPGVVDVIMSEATIRVGKVVTYFFPLCVAVSKPILSPYIWSQQTSRSSAVRRFGQSITTSLRHYEREEATPLAMSHVTYSCADTSLRGYTLLVAKGGTTYLTPMYFILALPRWIHAMRPHRARFRHH